MGIRPYFEYKKRYFKGKIHELWHGGMPLSRHPETKKIYKKKYGTMEVSLIKVKYTTPLHKKPVVVYRVETRSKSFPGLEGSSEYTNYKDALRGYRLHKKLAEDHVKALKKHIKKRRR